MTADPLRRAGSTDATDATDAAEVAEEQRAALLEGWRRSGLSLEAFWLRYYALCGDAGLLEVEAYLLQLVPLPPMEREVLAHALNEHAVELGEGPLVPHDHDATPFTAQRAVPSPMAVPTSPMAVPMSPMAVLIARLAQEEGDGPPDAVPRR